MTALPIRDREPAALRLRRMSGQVGWGVLAWVVGIAVKNLSKRFGRFQAVDGVTFEVPAGQLVALLGPSGSGKSTILRIIAGLETPEAGTVELTGEDATAVPIQRRGVALRTTGCLFLEEVLRGNSIKGQDNTICTCTT